MGSVYSVRVTRRIRPVRRSVANTSTWFASDGALIPNTSLPSLLKPRSSPMLGDSGLKTTSPGFLGSTRKGAASGAVL